MGWLIDPYERTVTVYRPGQEPQQLADPTEVSGDPELPGFVLDLAEVWQGLDSTAQAETGSPDLG